MTDVGMKVIKLNSAKSRCRQSRFSIQSLFSNIKTVLKSVIWLLIVVSQVLAVSGCRNKDGERALLDAVDIAKLDVTALEVRPAFGGTVLEQGTSVQFQAVGIRSDNSELDVSDRVAWSSADAAVFSVSSSGVVSAGTQDASAALNAEWGGLTSSLTVGVSTAPLVSLAFDGFPNSISECSSGTQLSVLGNYSDRTSNVTHLVDTWTSGDTSLATISASGIVTALNSGNVQLSAGYGGEAVAQNTSILDDLVALAISPSSAFSIAEGETATFVATGTDSSGDRDVSDVAVFSAQTTGVLTLAGAVASAVAVGSTQVFASCGGLTSNSVSVNVTEARQLSSLEIRYDGSSNDPVQLDVSDSPIQLRAFLIYSDSSEEEVTDNADLDWSVTATISGTAATVDNDGAGKGEVAFNFVGRTEITAVYDTDEEYREDTIDILVE